jgi:hypothetical protein
LVEHILGKDEVTGSIPVEGSSNINALYERFNESHLQIKNNNSNFGGVDGEGEI